MFVALLDLGKNSKTLGGVSSTFYAGSSMLGFETWRVDSPSCLNNFICRLALPISSIVVFLVQNRKKTNLSFVTQYHTGSTYAL
ncbi:uncharacterized protein H6S33_003226 [Morchella sextelata]|uniref:uncharacterized protein n=1 Tax=Morchella sextelata TaxID=1174677 RepID=UPI001D052A08|nr:uncharacterized protein H6S33_003226 [Morchella sextelata]KAH0607238.1 hypothetical protein H6S33_003226 [Morchella sextelata]